MSRPLEHAPPRVFQFQIFLPLQPSITGACERIPVVVARVESQGGCEGQVVLVGVVAVLVEPRLCFACAFVFLCSERRRCWIQNDIGHAFVFLNSGAHKVLRDLNFSTTDPVALMLGMRCKETSIFVYILFLLLATIFFLLA